MAGKLTDHEIKRRLALIQTDLVATPPILRLFVNNVTPDESTVLAGLTEASFPGYAPVALDYSGAITGPVAHVYTLPAVLETFTRSAGAGGDSVYGYFVTDSTDTFLLWAERDPAAPLDMSIPGAVYKVTANLTGTDA